MSNGVKTRFAGLLRELLRRFDETETGAETPQASRPVASGAPLPGMAPPSQIPAPQPKAAPSPATASKSLSLQGNNNIAEVELALPIVLQSLPPRLHARLTLTGEELSRASISIPVNKIMPQLALGTVKITFGELRQAAPTLFNTDEEYDSLPIVLPLNEILARLNPGVLTRNPAQKAIAVPEEITGPFGGRGEGINFCTTPLKPQTPAATPAPPIRMSTPSPRSANAAPPPVAPPPPAFVSRAVTPERPVDLPRNSNGNGNGHGAPRTGMGNGNGIPSKPIVPTAQPIIPAIPSRPVTPSAIPMASAGPKPMTARPAPATPAGELVMVPLSALSEGWPESLRTEIAPLISAHAQVALPVTQVEPALKRGRVTFLWRNLRPWIKPGAPAASVHDNLELELPLKVVAPLFLARLSGSPKTARAHQMEPLSDEIPNLFFGFPQPQPPADIPEPFPKAPAPDETHLTRKSTQNQPDQSNFFTWESDTSPQAAPPSETEFKRAAAMPVAPSAAATPATDFSSRHAAPKEVVARARALPGVAGALVALPDGLMVASHIPPEINADTLAAFLPQIYGRVSQSTKELRMGELNNLNFTVGNVPWKIFRIHGVFFAAFGRAGEQLPTAQLARLAAELDRKKQ